MVAVRQGVASWVGAAADAAGEEARLEEGWMAAAVAVAGEAAEAAEAAMGAQRETAVA